MLQEHWVSFNHMVCIMVSKLQISYILSIRIKGHFLYYENFVKIVKKKKNKTYARGT